VFVPRAHSSRARARSSFSASPSAPGRPGFGLPLHALAGGVSGGNGVFRYGGNSRFPTSPFNATNYRVDVAFVPR
jgi:hypothetical protein